MECLDLQRLRRCCRPVATEFDEAEIQVINDVSLYQIDTKKVVDKLQEADYISLETAKSVERHLRSQSELNVNQSTKECLATFLIKHRSFHFFGRCLHAAIKPLPTHFCQILREKGKALYRVQ